MKHDSDALTNPHCTEFAVFVDNDRMSGVARWSEGVVRSLGPEAELLVRYPSVGGVFDSSGLRVRPLHRGRSSSRLRAFIDAYSYGRRAGVGLVHCTSPQLPVVVGLAAAGVPVTVSVHVIPRRFVGRLAVFVTSLFAKKVIVVSEYMASMLSAPQFARPRRMIVIRNGVDVGSDVVLRPRERRTFGVVSRLTNNKGLEDFAVWANEICAETGWELHVFGEGPLEDHLHAAACPGIIFHGRVADQNAMYEKIGVLIIASPDETFCRPAAEAAIRGVPVISRYRLPAISEILGPHVIHPATADPADLIAVARDVARGYTSIPSARSLHNAVYPTFAMEPQAASVAAEFRMVAVGSSARV